jgi:mxaJ protein
MSSACRSLLALSLFLCAPVQAEALRVCADPNNLPFSNVKEEGFENKIVALIAKDLGERVEYTWRPQRIRTTLTAGICDLIPGVPNGLGMLQTTAPYYRSTYVFVTRSADKLALGSFDDVRLRTLRIAVQLIGDDGANSPPAHALARRGIIDNVRGFTVYGNYAQANPPARIIEAVANSDIDVAVVWGPLAGYFVPRQPVPLSIAPVHPEIEVSGLPMTFAISMGVRRGDSAFENSIDAVLVRERAVIVDILEHYGVPRLEFSHVTPSP